MNLTNIFKLFCIMSFPLIQSQIHATEILKSSGEKIDHEVDHINIFECDILCDQGDEQEYQECELNNLEIDFTKNGNIDVNQYNGILLNNCTINVDAKKHCLGNANMTLNNSKLIINNADNILNLLEQGNNIISLNNSSIIFNNNEDCVINLFADPKSYSKIELSRSNIEFNNNINLSLNNKSKIKLNNNSKLELLKSVINSNENSKISILNNSSGIFNNSNCTFNNNNEINIQNGSSCIFDNSDCTFNDNNEINLINAGTLYCKNKSKLDATKCSINSNNNSTCVFENCDIDFNNNNLTFNNGGKFISSNSTINFNDENFTANNSDCTFYQSTINIGSSDFIISGDPQTQVNFALIASVMQSMSFNCLFRISVGNRMEVSNSTVKCLGKLIKLGSGKTDYPLFTIKNESYFAWDDINCDHGYDFSVSEDSTVVIIKNLLLDDGKNKLPENEQK